MSGSGTPGTSGAVASPLRMWAALVALSVPIVALSVDVNGVVVLLPDLASDLGVAAATAGAIVTVASLAYAAPLLAVGRLAARVGARPLLLGGVAGFWVASAICAFATTFPMLLAGRVLQGVASAFAMTTSLMAVDVIFDDRRRPVAIGLWGAIGGVGGAAAPIVASVIGAAAGWRWFFGINLVLLSVAMVALAVLVPRLPADPARSLPVGRLAVLIAGLTLLVGGVQHATAGGWGSPGTVVPVVMGLAALGVAWLVRRPADPIVPAAVSGSASFRLGTLLATVSNWGSGVVMVLVPLALQEERGLGVLATGVVFLAFSALFALGGAASGPAINRFGGPRTLALPTVVFVAGMVLLAVAGSQGPMWLVVVGLAVAGLGNGVVYSASTTVALAGVGPTDTGEATATLGMLRVIGLALAVAVSTSMVTSLDGPGSSAGLRLALVVGAVITAAGLPAALAAQRRGVGTAPGAPAPVHQPEH